MPDLITTPFGSSSTADEVLAGVDLTGQRAVVTGGATGIGRETTRALAAAGAEVTVATRNVAAGRRLAAEPAGNIQVATLDLADLDSVDTFVRAWSGPLHILVNNAGIMAVPDRQTTAQGHELQFGTNYLGHFALVLGLHDALAEAGGARIVSVSSNAHFMSDVVYDDVDYTRRDYDPWTAYGQSKTGDVLLAVEATRRWNDGGIVANSLNPGAIATGLQKHTGGLRTPEHLRKTPPQGAATSVLLAASPLLDGVGGRYFEDCNESPVLTEPPEMFGKGVAAWAVDADNAAHLWDVATGLVKR
ncbi:SDR family NAD(P)-dependent oxidoreductase [Pseudonocardia sp. N23]|uniref:SDR family NAD(P)-dependent oxidoreductase n=1 Tax=Pseudonocardia sp. N23 TaxID=1987376 RepID=UPI000BFB587C|nr:SDR family NAD(P)-dependent oxidoreductase [Pseudonocardia sp. N23]GAY07401.1 probable oxidoreductase [Pseudonocardia sp. N23]